MKIRNALVLATMLAVVPATAMAANTNANTGQTAGAAAAVNPDADMKDMEAFVVNVPSSNAFEIQSSELALQMGSSREVKTFAQQMIDDHTKAGAAFKAAVEKAGMTVPGDSLNERHQAMLDTLKQRSTDFDQAYMQAQLQAHREAVDMFTIYAEGGDNASIKAFAEKTLPTLKQHLAMVEQMTGSDATGSTTRGDTMTPGMDGTTSDDNNTGTK